MRGDYRQASRRHWRDARHLENDSRAANADQLYGITAECALKHAMAALGAPTGPSGDLSDRRHWIHIDKLWSEYQSFASGRRGSYFLSPLARFRGNPFDDWQIAGRYAADSETPGGATLDSHRKACRACLAVADRASGVP